MLSLTVDRAPPPLSHSQFEIRSFNLPGVPTKMSAPLSRFLTSLLTLVAPKTVTIFVPAVASVSASLAIWFASSRVGEMMSVEMDPRVRGGPRMRLSSVGMRKAAVLPVPVLACRREDRDGEQTRSGLAQALLVRDDRRVRT